MTIAAGFKYRGGILLATDTQHTYSRMLKLSRPKLVRLDLDDAKLGIAIAGNVDFALMATEKIKDEILNEEITHAFIKHSIETILLDIYQKHVYPSGMYYENAFDLMIAAWTKAEGLKLMQTSASSITEVKDYGIIGIGLYLAQYLSKSYSPNAMEAHAAFMFAVDILQKVKDNVDGCGGRTDVLLLDDSGYWTPVHSTEVAQIETFARDFDDIAGEFSKVVADLSLDEEELDEFFELIKTEIHSMRTEQKQRIKRLNKVIFSAEELRKKKS